MKTLVRECRNIGSLHLQRNSMRRYFDLKDFICFLSLLEENKPSEVITESQEGEINRYSFMKMQFGKNLIILYDTPYCNVGMIQDSPVAPWEDYAEGVFEDLTQLGECKMFIEDSNTTPSDLVFEGMGDI